MRIIIKGFKCVHGRARGLIGILAAVWFCTWLGTLAQAEETFPVLQIGSHTYTNVTVTTKAEGYIFIVHSTGMLNIKVVDLPPELQESLGYKAAAAAKAKSNAPPAVALAQQTLAKVQTPQVKAAEERMRVTWEQQAARLRSYKVEELKKALAVIGGVMFLLFLFWSYCCKLVCEKSGTAPGFLVWVPLLQIYPLLRAAGMSGWWALAFALPGLNVLASVRWSLKIARVRGYGIILAILLILPVTNIFAFLFLAFSQGPTKSQEKQKVSEIMTLEAA